MPNAMTGHPWTPDKFRYSPKAPSAMPEISVSGPLPNCRNYNNGDDIFMKWKWGLPVRTPLFFVCDDGSGIRIIGVDRIKVNVAAIHIVSTYRVVSGSRKKSLTSPLLEAIIQFFGSTPIKLVESVNAWLNFHNELTQGSCPMALNENK